MKDGMLVGNGIMSNSNTETELGKFVSVKTLAKQWDCSRTTVMRMLESAGINAYCFGQGRTGSKRFRLEDIDRFLKSIEKA